MGGLGRPLHVDGDALSVQLQLHPQTQPTMAIIATSQLLSPFPAHHGVAPADRHAQDGRPGRRRQQILAVPSTSCRRCRVHRAICRPATTQQIAHFSKL